MKIAEILALTKAGYSLSEIKSLEHRSEVLELVQNGVGRDEVNDYLELMAEEEPEPEKAGGEEEPDYKALYEAEKAKNQKANSRKESEEPEEESVEDILANILKG